MLSKAKTTLGNGRGSAPLWLAAAVALMGIVASGCQLPSIAILHDGLDTPRFTRYNFLGVAKSPETTVYDSNLLKDPPVAGAGPGVKVVVKSYTETRIDMDVNGLPFKLLPKDANFPTDAKGIDEFLDKHFAKNPGEVKLDALESNVKNLVLQGKAAKGMTKEQVILAVGYPARVGASKLPTTTLTREQILNENQWGYRYGLLSWQTYSFNLEGKLESWTK
jgi:hypothetical protein